MHGSGYSVGSGNGSASVVTFDTRVVEPWNRLDYWEEQCAEHIVGLKCSCLDEKGLQARSRHSDLGSIRITDIVGGQHAIERAPTMVRTVEKDAVFMTLVVQGAAFFSQAGRCILLNAGDSFIYDTNRPYLHGVPGFMHHVIFEVPGEEFRRRCPGWNLAEAHRYDGALSLGADVSRALNHLLTRYRPLDGIEALSEPVEEELWDVLCLAHRLARSGQSSAYHFLMMGRIREFISANLRDPDLSPPKIAEYAGISVRQLNRLFETEPQSVSQTLIAMRLERCRADLLNKGIPKTSISEISYSWGFRSPANFSRSFRAYFGYSPSEC
jgi:AraC-like DNA-binding protein